MHKLLVEPIPTNSMPTIAECIPPPQVWEVAMDRIMAEITPDSMASSSVQTSSLKPSGSFVSDTPVRDQGTDSDKVALADPLNTHIADSWVDQVENEKQGEWKQVSSKKKIVKKPAPPRRKPVTRASTRKAQ